MAKKQPAPAEQTPEAFLGDAKSILTDLRGELNKRVPESPVRAFIEQQLQQAETAIDQGLRNIKIDAEFAAKKAEGIIKNAY